MLQLNSKNYEAVFVYIRDYDEPLELAVDKGTALMKYLSGPKSDVGLFVSLTDVSGTVSVIRTSEILRVLPVQKAKEIEDYV